SLFTSVITNLLVKGIPEAIMRSPAKKLFVCNLLTEPGETNGYSAEDHIQRLLAYFTKQVFDLVVVNNWPISEATYRRCRADGMGQVWVKEPGDLHAERGIGSLVLDQGRYQVPVLYRDLVDERETVHHHRGKLAGAVFEAYELLATERLNRFCCKGKFP
ncbi:MAG: 2-phospho-L-lactate transferase CofD family protein, partial [Candidatus Hodarchaeota archaeon]